MVDPLRTLIADDEAPPRRHLRALLAEEPGVVLVGECRQGDETLALARRTAPDVLFLDVRLPGLDDAGVLPAVADELAPAVVFVASDAGDAVKAFEAHALDFLLKPVGRERLREVLTRARAVRRLAVPDLLRVDARLVQLLERFEARRRYTRRLAVRTADRAILIPIGSIDWIEAAGKYVRLHVGAQHYELRDSMTHVAQQLDPEQFIRLSRSAIVNIDRIQEIQPWFQGDSLVLVRGGARIVATQGYRVQLRHLLGKPGPGTPDTAP